MKLLKIIKHKMYIRRTPILETERLILRPIVPNDAADIFNWVSDDRVTKYMTYSTYKNMDEVYDFIYTVIPESKSYHWGFALKENNRLIGSGSIGFSTKHNAWNFGYNFCYDFWGNGYATEAAVRMIRFAYEELGAHDFCATHALENSASGRVIEKCGLKFEQEREYSKKDSAETYKAKFYRMHLD